MLNWGPIVYIFAVVPVVIYSKRRGSARWLVVGGAALGCFGTVLRLLPVWIHMPFPAIYLVHAGQMCNAAVGPIGMCMPPKISGTWFPDNERYACNAGVSVAMAVNPPCVCVSASFEHHSCSGADLTEQNDGDGGWRAGQHLWCGHWFLRSVPRDDGR